MRPESVAGKYPVTQRLQLGDKTIVRYDVPYSGNVERNVECFGDDGQLRWTIQTSPYKGGSPTISYVFIEIDILGALIARNFCGIEYLVDLQDGTVQFLRLRRF